MYVDMRYDVIKDLANHRGMSEFNRFDNVSLGDNKCQLQAKPNNIASLF